MPKFLFLDLETTGLNPRKCAIVEVAAVICEGDFAPIAAFSAIIDPLVSSGRWEEKALEMHKVSGLYDLLAGGLSVADVGETLAQFINQHRAGEKVLHLAGSSVHFDRGFLNWEMPDVAAQLHHRILDVTSVRLLGSALGLPPQEAGPAPHRARQDVAGSIRELAYYVRTFGVHLVDGFEVRGERALENLERAALMIEMVGD